MGILGGVLSALKAGKKIWAAVKKPMPKTIAPIAKTAAKGLGELGLLTAGTVAGTALVSKFSGATGGIAALQGLGGSAAGLLPQTIDISLCKTYVRAPRGFVVVRDPASGQIAVVRKDIARAMRLWRPTAKPPISATDWKHYKRNKQIEKKLRHIAGPALRKHATRQPAGKGKK